MSTLWVTQAACRHFPDLFTTKAHEKDAVHICRRHCPVRVECSAAFRGLRNIDIVVGGRAYGHDGEVLERLHGTGDAQLHNPWCRAVEEREAALTGARKQQKEAGA